ncbi:fimbrial biogenesis outer membrane usher protein [Salmonella enterica]|nr:fimbrial biogenesis outer membrane usher protein [Salmonella enterica]
MKSSELGLWIVRGVILCALMKHGTSFGQYNFEAGFFKSLGLDSDNVDLSLFNEGASFLPGEYTLSIYVNDHYISTQSVLFTRANNYQDPIPCFSESEWAGFGVTMRAPDKSLVCTSPSEYTQGAQWRINMDAQRLDITVPQAALTRSDMFKTPWQSWQEGSNALLLNYNYIYGNSSQPSQSSGTSQYLALNSGINLQGVRFRNSSNWVKSINQPGKFDTLRSYIQKDYHFLQGGELSLGEAFSDGNLFESIPFKGIMASSLEDMVRPEFQNFTPVVRGVVSSQSANVSVIKNGNIIYQETLPSGPFSLDGVMNNGGGDYLIQIAESDGSVRSYTQYADSLPALQSKGRLKYNVLSGKTNFINTKNTSVNQGSLFYGMTDSFTLYGGIVVSDNYHAYSAGIGKTMGAFGAVAFDVTASDAVIKGNDATVSRKGEAFRLSYYKDFADSATTLGLLAYRYAAEDYIGFREFIEYDIRNNLTDRFTKNRAEVSLVQRLDKFGNLSLSGNYQSYWNNTDNAFSYNINHNINFGRFSVRSYYSQNSTLSNMKDKVVGLGGTFFFSENGRNYSVVNNTSSRNGKFSNNTSASTGFLDNSISLSASQNLTQGEDMRHGLAANYMGSYYDASTSYYTSPSNRQVNVNLKGGALLYKGGGALSRYFSIDSPMAIVETPGVSGVHISNGINIQTDYFGHAVVGNLQPYQRNQIGIDASSLKGDVETSETDRTVIPRKGSVMPIKFKVSKGQKALFDVTYQGKLIPLGAVASIVGDNNTPQTAFFADRGQVYLTGLESSGKVKVRWGPAETSSCEFTYVLDNKSQFSLYRGTQECK